MQNMHVIRTSEISCFCCSSSFLSSIASPIDAACITLEQICSSATPLHRILTNKQMASV